MSGRVPQPFPIRKLNRINKFSDAPGQPDGIVLSSSHDHGTPFGQPFKYTDATDLPGDFTNPGATGSRGARQGRKARWYNRLFRRKPPLAWAVVNPEWGQANICPPGEPRVSRYGPGAIVKVYDDRLVLAADEYERNQDGSTRAGGSDQQGDQPSTVQRATATQEVGDGPTGLPAQKDGPGA